MSNDVPGYCQHCGTLLLRTTIEADKIKVWHPDSMGGSLFRLDSPFNKKTGQKNIAVARTCPNWKSNFFTGSNAHDKIIIYEKELHYL